MFFDHHTVTASPTSTELTPDALNRAREAPSAGSMIRIRPFIETDGIAAGSRFLRGLHSAPAGTLCRGGAPVYAAEIWFTGGKLQFSLRAPGPHDAIALVDAHYPNSDTEEVTGFGFPHISTGEHVAGCHLELRQDAAFPVKHRDSHPSLDGDPYRTLLSQLAGTDDETAFLQIVFMPVAQTWARRGLLGRFGGGAVSRIAHSRRQGQVEGYFQPQVIESKTDTQAADDIAAQVGRPSFATTIRAMAIAPDAATAEHRLSCIADAFGTLDHEHTGQGFDPRYATASHLPAVLEATAMRTLTPESRLKRTLWGRANVLTVNELAALVHLPNDEVEIPAIDWSRRASGGGVPADSRRYSASRSETGVDHSERDSGSGNLTDSGPTERPTFTDSNPGQQAADGGNDGV